LRQSHGYTSQARSVEVDHPARGKYLTIRNLIKLSESPIEVTRLPLPDEHTDEIPSEAPGLSSDDLLRHHS